MRVIGDALQFSVGDMEWSVGDMEWSVGDMECKIIQWQVVGARVLRK